MALWQALVSCQLTYGMPNPPQGGFLHHDAVRPPCSTACLRLILNRWKEYLGGIAALGLPLLFVWSTGLGGFVCGGYLTVVVWIWVSTSWWRFHLPPFRLAIWHTMGVNIGALGGSLLYHSLVMCDHEVYDSSSLGKSPERTSSQ